MKTLLIPEGYVERHDEVIDKVRKSYNHWSFKDGLFIPLSGGVDSSTALAYAVNYADNRRWERSDITSLFCLRQGMYDGEKEDLEAAEFVANYFGVDFKKKDITKILTALEGTVSLSGIPIDDDERICLARALVTRTLEEKVGKLSVDTGNFSEAMLAQWTTGSWVGKIDILGKLFKTEVYELAESLGVPKRILKRAKVSSELRNGTLYKEYERIDPILFLYLVGKTNEEIAGKRNEPKEYVDGIITRVREQLIRAHSAIPIISTWNYQQGNDTNPNFQELHRSSYNDSLQDKLVADLHKKRTARWDK